MFLLRNKVAILIIIAEEAWNVNSVTSLVSDGDNSWRQEDESTSDCSTRDSIQSSRRREITRVCDDGLRVCRHPLVLLPPAQGSESYKDGNRSTIVRMGSIEGSHSTDSSETPDARCGGNLQSSTRPPESTRGAIEYRVSSIECNRPICFVLLLHVCVLVVMF